MRKYLEESMSLHALQGKTRSNVGEVISLSTGRYVRYNF